MLFYFSSTVVIILFFPHVFVLVSISVYFCIIGSNKDYLNLNLNLFLVVPHFSALQYDNTLFSTYYLSTLILYRRSLDTFYMTLFNPTRTMFNGICI